MKKAHLASCFALVSLVGINQFALAADPAHPDQPSVAPAEAISKLKEGNGRYTSGNLQHPGQTTERRTELANVQHPFAVIVSCSDSRVPPEIVFDQGLGDLFIVRVAGNIINDEGLGSIEYAVTHLGARLIVVLGHTHCGAVTAALESDHAPGHVQSLVRDIQPAVKAIKGKPGDALAAAITENARLVAAQIKAKAVLGDLAKEVRIVFAIYDLDTGKIEWPKD